MTKDERKIAAILKKHEKCTGDCDCRVEVKKIAWKIYDDAALAALRKAYYACGGYPLDLWFDGIWRVDENRSIHGWVY